MLVWQALFASELFQSTSLDQALAAQIRESILLQTTNVVLIGMPGAGKTTAGRALARLTHRPFIDLDDAFEVEVGSSAAAYITAYGEEAFREQESAIAARYGAQSGLVIASGGGIVTRQRNYPAIHQNASIVYVNRPLYQLTSAGRPLSQSRGIRQLAKERLSLYESWADEVISCTGSAAGDALLIRAKLGL